MLKCIGLVSKTQLFFLGALVYLEHLIIKVVLNTVGLYSEVHDMQYLQRKSRIDRDTTIPEKYKENFDVYTLPTDRPIFTDNVFDSLLLRDVVKTVKD